MRPIATYLLDPAKNGVGRIDTALYLFSSHYDADHISGIDRLRPNGVAFREAFDQGISKKRRVLASNPYGNYVRSVGDPNNNHRRDSGEAGFVRQRAAHSLTRSLGAATITVVSVNGDTEGSQHDLPLDPSIQDIDENPGSIALLIRLGDFEYYTAEAARSTAASELLTCSARSSAFPWK